MFASMRAPVLSTLFLVGLMGVGLTLTSVASAQEEAADDTPAVVAEATEEAAPAAYDAADSAYMINTLIMFVGAVLVLFMQAGLDISQHGMHAYPSDAVSGGAIA